MNLSNKRNMELILLLMSKVLNESIERTKYGNVTLRFFVTGLERVWMLSQKIGDWTFFFFRKKNGKSCFIHFFFFFSFLLLKNKIKFRRRNIFFCFCIFGPNPKLTFWPLPTWPSKFCSSLSTCSTWTSIEIDWHFLG